MNSRTTRQFRELFAALPRHVQNQASDAYRLFKQDPAHPGLRFKRVHDSPLIYSARVGIGYRSLAAIDGDTAIWFWIGSHADYDKVLNQL